MNINDIIISHVLTLWSSKETLMCDDVPATVPQDDFALYCVRVFRGVKLICPSNVINPRVNVSFDKGLLFISLLSFHSEKIFLSSNASSNLYPKMLDSDKSTVCYWCADLHGTRSPNLL